MARAVVHSQTGRLAAFEPLYEISPTGATIEVFYADRVLAHSFGAPREGWYWWRCQPGSLPVVPPTGPFDTSYGAYRNAVRRVCKPGAAFGKRLSQ